MKSASVLAALGAILGVVSAHGGHNHDILHRLMKKGGDVSPASKTQNATCGCVTSVVTWYGEATCMSQQGPLTVHVY
jgi:hypothetical protein